MQIQQHKPLYQPNFTALHIANAGELKLIKITDNSDRKFLKDLYEKVNIKELLPRLSNDEANRWNEMLEYEITRAQKPENQTYIETINDKISINQRSKDINFNIEDYNTVFPVVLVLLRSKVLGDRPQYKIRRTWKVTKYTNDENLLLEISQIINSSSFQEIRNLDVYDGDSAVINDFNQTRLPLYKREYVECDNPNVSDKEIVISTTYHTSERVIRFSLHPKSMIVGRVIASFDVPIK